MKDLSLHILDLVHNAATARASQIDIAIREDVMGNRFAITVLDNGKGIGPEMLSTVTDAYTTSRKSRKVGLGLPLLKHSAEQSGGNLQVESVPGKGTTVTAIFKLDHIDRPPLGDIAGVLIQLFGAFEEIRFNYDHQTENGKFRLDTNEIKEVLGGVSVNNREIRNYLKEMIAENLMHIHAGQ